jgi:HAD superfamily hydrolase (TIGR01509 family)
VNFELVIFDCDGVLVDSEPISNRVLAEALTEIGLPTTTAQAMRTYMGRSRAACLEIIESKLGRPVPGSFPERWRVRTLAALARELEPVAGVAAALDAIAAPVCVASSSDPERVRVSLDRTGLLERFDGRLFSASEVARGKPAPDLFLHAAERLGARAERCAVVEDTPLGVEAAVAAAMTPFGFAPHAGASALRAAGATVFRDMAELPRLLGR